MIERERAVLFDQPGLLLAVAAAGVVAHALQSEAALETADPWSRRDGWRIHGGARRRFDLLVGQEQHVATLERRHDGALRLGVAGESCVFSARALGGDRHDVTLDGERHC